MKHLIIDGNNLLWRYLSVGDNPQESVSSFFRCLFSIERQSGRTFDRTLVITEPLDKERDGDYKSQRPPVPEAYARAFGEALEVLPHLKFSHVHAVEKEADRLIASYTRGVLAEEGDNEVAIATSDKDMCQLIQDPKVSCMRPEQNWITYRERNVLARYKVHPSRLALYLALAGDKSDNIPGAKGWGPKAAAEAAAVASTPEEMAVMNIPGVRKGLVESLHAQWEEFVGYYALTNLRDEEPIPWPVPRPNRVAFFAAIRKAPYLAWLQTKL